MDRREGLLALKRDDDLVVGDDDAHVRQPGDHADVEHEVDDLGGGSAVRQQDGPHLGGQVERLGACGDRRPGDIVRGGRGPSTLTYAQAPRSESAHPAMLVHARILAWSGIAALTLRRWLGFV